MTDELISTALPGPQTSVSDEEVAPKKRKPYRTRAVKLTELESELQDRIREYVAVPLGFMSPLACAVLDQRAERTAKALCRIAATSPRMLKALQRFVAGSAVVDLGGTAVAVVIALSVDLHRIEPTSMPARYARIPELWPMVYPDESMWEFSSNGGGVDLRGSFLDDEAAGD